jgi:LysM repeat protein
MGLLEKASVRNKESNSTDIRVECCLHEKYQGINTKHIFLICLTLFLCYFQLFYGSMFNSFPKNYSGIFSSLFEKNQDGMGMPFASEELLAIENDPSMEIDEFIIGVPEPESFSETQMVSYIPYKIEAGDIIGEISQNFGLTQDTLLSVNEIKNSRLIQIGQVLKIPNQDGIAYTVKSGDTLSSIAETYECDVDAIRTANELFSDAVHPNSTLFLPGARLNSVEVQEINGDLFIWPINGYITSPYGYRPSPFTGVRQFHTGLDIGSPSGTPIKAAMAGRVSAAGYDDISGNHVVITHHSGYRTLYAHMSVIRAKVGTYVRTGDRIGDVGSTGLSTGPHLHFTVYKNGVTVSPLQLIK